MDIKITGIGSLPHHNIDSALEYSFRHDIPYLPQLPGKAPEEMMIYQALEGLPGLQMKDQQVELDLKKWLLGSKEYERKLDKVLAGEDFEFSLPGPRSQSCWSGFLFELEERGTKQAKIQLAGPLSSQQILKLTDGDSIKPFSELMSQCYKTVFARAMVMTKTLLDRGVEPIFFFDEPALYAYTPADPYYITGIEELRLAIINLKKMGAKTGLHCCSNTDWRTLLGLPIDYLSFDFFLSHAEIAKNENELQQYLNQGGSFCLGLIPTQETPELSQMIASAKTFLNAFSPKQAVLISPACGLAFQSPGRAEDVYSMLQSIKLEY